MVLRKLSELSSYNSSQAVHPAASTDLSPQRMGNMLGASLSPLKYLFPRSLARPLKTQTLPFPGIFSHEPLISCV